MRFSKSVFVLFFLPFAMAHFSMAFCQQVDQPAEDPNANNGRPFQDKSDARYWMNNMVAYHRFTDEEIQWATGMEIAAIKTMRKEMRDSGWLESEFKKGRLKMLPYPGGRHPRIGFLDGAIRPQRETKISVFLPWDTSSYVVVDVPEAIWSNLGLTYLAHTHIPTYFDKQKESLKKMEWERRGENELFLKRVLPNGIEFSSRSVAKLDHIRMVMKLKNGTGEKLSDLRVQNCVMLKAAKEFNQQSNENKRFIGPYVVCHDPTKKRWIITAWKPVHRPWANPPCPCLHSDPKFPDCDPGKTQRLDGWLSFFVGKDIDAEIKRIEKTEWWKPENQGAKRP